MDNPDKKIIPLRNYRLLEFSKTDNLSRLYWPTLIDRVTKFVPEYGVDTDSAWLFDSLNRSFLLGGEEWLIMGMIDEAEEKIVGHLIAQYQPYNRLGYVIFIHQLECDVFPEDIKRTGWARVKAWAAEKNTRYIFNHARTQAVARLYRSKFGFTDHRVIQQYDMLKGAKE